MTGPQAISLDQWIALNDEIAALTRAGVPLERGLVELGQDLPGRLGKLAATMGQRMEAGESLDQVLASASPAFPPLYRAVVAAGLRSGRLAVALEGIATTLRRVAELRRTVAAALIYPLILLTVLYGLFLFALTNTLPVVLDPNQPQPLTGGWIEMLRGLSETVWWWAPWPPLIVGSLLGVWWYRSRRATSMGGVTGRLPSVSRLLENGRLATFAEVLALLIEQQVPLDEAVVLAGEASGDHRLATAARQLAAEMQRGQLAAGAPAGFPPALGLLMALGYGPAELSGALRRAAQGYRQRAQRMADWLTVYLPIFLAVVVGGAATLIYALAVLGPWYQLLYEWA